MQQFDPKLSLGEVRDFLLQLYVMLEAGVPIISALECIANSEHLKISPLAEGIARTISEGQYLSRALQQYPKTFDSFTIALVRLGERSGQLIFVLRRLTSRTEWRLRVRRRLIESLSYPVGVISISLGLVAFLTHYMLPRILPLLTSLEVPIPAPTRFLLAVVEYQGVSAVLMALFLVFLVDVIFGQTERQRALRHWILYSTPVLGPVNRNRALAHFCSDLGMVLESGLKLTDALEILGSECPDLRLKHAIKNVRKDIIAGEELTASLESQDLPKLLVSAVVAGADSGQLPSTLERIAVVFDGSAESLTDQMLQLLEPLTIFVLGCIVGGILLACFLPLYSMITNGI